ncbi:MAG TPA: hypothetical protein VJZ72_11020 [Candidatus Limnocylindrales bacterium]|nr:hypothetical protein [Candidatus Limnocylindrales bacterium]
MDPRRLARRELTILAVVVLALTRVTDGAALVAVSLLFLAMLVMGALVIFAEGEPAGVPIETLMPVAAAGIASVALVRVMPVGALLLPAIGAAAALIHVAVGVEARIVSQARPPDDRDRRSVLWVSLATCFVAFLGLPVAVVDAGLSAEQATWALPIAEGIVAALLGYRLAALRRPDLRAALFSALTYGVIIALAGVALRTLSLPRLVEPALLVLVFYLWDAAHATEPGRRREVRWIAELAVLAILGVAVVFLVERA